ncbi:MAG TPA: CoA transferase [Devosiaceae bacterium]|jgi:crotonobetainyl-CoA:carnitine CoA-transferase CaiB-like acyl-CoA transferase
MTGPLSGVRVLDLTHVLNGPFATMLLAHMGAEVLKVEHGDGDRYRHSWMPPNAGRDGYESLAVNANKKCITLNLKHPEGRQMFEQLLKQSDVLVENFALGTMERLGLSYEELKKINPRIIYAVARGFGDSGPYANMRAFAPTVMASAGWVDAAWKFSGRPGTKVLGIGDEAAGVSLALGITTALYSREKTGEGTKIEISMQEAMLGFMVSTLHTLFEGNPVGGRYFECADGYVSFHLPDWPDDLWRALTTSLGHEEAASDPRFIDMKTRRKNFPQVQEMVAEMVRGHTRAELWEIFQKHQLASSPVLSIGEVVENEHIKARGAFVEVEHPKAGALKLLRPWIRFSEMPTGIDHAGPAIGEHNASVYKELLGIDEGKLEQLKADGAI